MFTLVMQEERGKLITSVIHDLFDRHSSAFLSLPVSVYACYGNIVEPKHAWETFSATFTLF